MQVRVQALYREAISNQCFVIDINYYAMNRHKSVKDYYNFAN